MTYSTTQDFIDAFSEQEMIQLTNLWDATQTEINEDNLLKNQQRAFSWINAYISSSAGNALLLPFSEPYPELLVTLEVDIAWYYLHKSQATEEARLRYEDAMKQLKMIAEGKLKLGLDSETPQAVITGSNLPQVLKPCRVFTKESLHDFSI